MTRIYCKCIHGALTCVTYSKAVCRCTANVSSFSMPSELPESSAHTAATLKDWFVLSWLVLFQFAECAQIYARA